jgi:ribosome-binding protein aMBF1 (putative translation factor)
MTTTTRPLLLAEDVRGRSNQELRELVADGAFTIRQAVQFSGIGRTRLYDLIKAKQIISMKGEGVQRLIPRRELVRFLADRLAAELTEEREAH